MTNPVEDTVAKVDGYVAVGEDLEFQRRWWRFERVVWTVFVLILVCDLLGLLGRGYLAKAQSKTSDQSVTMDYERIERTNTPSIITVNFGPGAIHGGEVRLFVSGSVVKELGAQRVVPQPKTSEIGDGGVTYTFEANRLPATVDIALSPSLPGIHHFTLGVPGSEMVQAKVTVLP